MSTTVQLVEVTFDPDTVTNREIIQVEEFCNVTWSEFLSAWTNIVENPGSAPAKFIVIATWLMSKRAQPDLTLDDVMEWSFLDTVTAIPAT